MESGLVVYWVPADLIVNAMNVNMCRDFTDYLPGSF